jgi:hypothetical protein
MTTTLHKSTGHVTMDINGKRRTTMPNRTDDNGNRKITKIHKLERGKTSRHDRIQSIADISLQ